MKRCQHHAVLVTLVMFVGICSASRADTPPEMPSQPELGPPGKADLPPLGDVSGIGKGPGRASPTTIRKAIETARADRSDEFRGAAKRDPLRRLGRSVVLVVTPTQLGSATLIDGNGTFVTSWHVVKDVESVGIIYMPLDRDSRPMEADAVQATVSLKDPETDLALLHVAKPARGARPIRMAIPSTVRQGARLLVLGHPYGEVWTYTQGTLTALHKDQTWKSGDGSSHRADIVEFQSRSVTGNAGGPVLDAHDRLLAIDVMRSDEKSMRAMAVSAGEVRRLKASGSGRHATRSAMAPAPALMAPQACEPARLDTRRTRAGDGTVHILDLNCNGRADAMLLVPDNVRLSDNLASDANENGITDAVYFDFNRDGRFDEVRFDTDEDGKADMVGNELDVDLVPKSVRVIAR